MSDAIHHECGIALLRLRKPLGHYLEKHGTALYGLNKMVLMMEKQHNRGQDGAGIAGVKLDMAPGQRYISRYRSVEPKPMQDIFQRIQTRVNVLVDGKPERLKDVHWVKENLAFACEVYLGHLRYGTFGGNSIEACHPFLRQSNWMSRNLIVAGNFNMTNVKELVDELVSLGQHPKERADTVTVMEKIGHFLDKENERLHKEAKDIFGMAKMERSVYQMKNLQLPRVLRKAAEAWDGGYAMGGMVGQGDAFLLRDPNGIRPAYYYVDDEVAVVASERPVIQTAFGVDFDEVKEVPPGHMIWIRRNGDVSIEKVLEPRERLACSFERIYFSRGNDGAIYKERLELGRRLANRVLDAADRDFDRTVFSFIPNTAEISFYGLVKGVEDALNEQKIQEVKDLAADAPDSALRAILERRSRVEKIAWKDVKLRTFIAEEAGRDDMVAHVYDSTYNVIQPNDTLVAVDDSIVRGTTLKQSILRMLDRLGPKRIIIVSSAPQIRYPDCYGIDMAKIGDFAAFRAAVSLLKERHMENVLTDALADALAQLALPMDQQRNAAQAVYAPFSDQEISDRIAQMLTPPQVKAEVKVIYQTVEDLHASCPENLGDWYFTGNYPTPGGTRVANRAFVNYMEGSSVRAY
ncbi:MAG: amidophosphoribosyltransferase [Cryomorphaceae bacterium BACL7 MAG-120910-bin2]|nr:MAG: amidophosphoribosyltransferase [Cryomorphaceae bacterium BACL7 MAG-120910-bin2]KRO69160.1 MAG: amidophosphoribosyltransferase [Cryomorphaceae bacterium BACL7 MAG-120322-bin74]KRO83895.1 MAG: amidophosphoribosyltransferase [Cryomorphaceae bacterium BACL7 MAG-121220-bin83]NQW24946.1 amidophosphoribosyltransferase [Cryomorphaceae bacterium]